MVWEVLQENGGDACPHDHAKPPELVVKTDRLPRVWLTVIDSRRRKVEYNSPPSLLILGEECLLDDLSGLLWPILGALVLEVVGPCELAIRV